jgi:hypothetical protein
MNGIAIWQDGACSIRLDVWIRYPQTGGMVMFLPHKFHHVGVDSAFVPA